MTKIQVNFTIYFVKPLHITIHKSLSTPNNQSLPTFQCYPSLSQSTLSLYTFTLTLALVMIVSPSLCDNFCHSELLHLHLHHDINLC